VAERGKRNGEEKRGFVCCVAGPGFRGSGGGVRIALGRGVVGFAPGLDCGCPEEVGPQDPARSVAAGRDTGCLVCPSASCGGFAGRAPLTTSGGCLDSKKREGGAKGRRLRRLVGGDGNSTVCVTRKIKPGKAPDAW